MYICGKENNRDLILMDFYKELNWGKTEWLDLR